MGLVVAVANEKVAAWAGAVAQAVVAVIDAALCTGCGICIEACVDKAISVNRSATVDPGLCSGCGACVPECPNEALSLGRPRLERGATG